MINRFIKRTKKKGIADSLNLVFFHIRTLFYYKSKFLLKFITNGFKSKKILFYPQQPWDQFVIYKICHLLGYKISGNINIPSDLIFSWDISTTRKKNKLLENLSKKQKIPNLTCKDISKKHTGEIFRKTFGYSILVNPLKYRGECVQKSNENAKKDGKVINAPIKNLEKGAVYERFIDSDNGQGILLDMRVPVLGKEIPFVYLRYKSKELRFLDDKKPKVALVETQKVFTSDEMKKIINFCKKLGMDYGELDILRDIKDKKIYVVDANPTPFGPHRMSRKITRDALRRLSESFKRNFII